MTVVRDDEGENLMQEAPTNRNRWLLGLGALVVVLALVIAALLIADDDEDDVDTGGSTTTTAEDTTSTTEATTTSSMPSSIVDPTTVVFPDPSTSRRFDAPEALVTAFATDLLGFGAPIVGELQQGDSRSGEIEVRPFAQGEPTTVLVRQMEDDTWFVLGTVVESIRLDSPEAGATIASPLELAGAAHAFEGTVDVRLYADGTTEPIATTFVTGRGDGVLGDFEGELTFEAPAGAEHGVLVLSSAGGEDGSTIAATVIRVHF